MGDTVGVTWVVVKNSTARCWLVRDLQGAAQLASQKAGVPIECTGAARFSPAICAARYKLDNGLTIVFAPDDRAPIFAYQTWFKVGSKDEDPSRTGLAHLFEHLMFKGTKKFATGTFDREMERRGTQTNAATWVDWTYYHEALAARGDNLQAVIDFEADRMHNLLLDEATFRSELEVVKNERRMSVEDSVMGSLTEKLYGLAYTTHTYRWPTIGSMEHLQASTLGDLERFYRTYYAPNNAVVVVAGDLDAVDTLAMIAKAYGDLQSQPVPKRQYAAEPVQSDERWLRVQKPVMTPQIVMGYHAPKQLDVAHDALEILCDALTSGDSARLYRRLVTDEQVAAEVDGSTTPFAEPGLFEVVVTLRPDVDPLHVVNMVQEELDKTIQGLSEAELDKAKNGLLLGFHEGFRSAEATAEGLGHYEANYGDFRLAFAGEERLAKVDAALIKSTAQQVFSKTNRTVVIADPIAVAPVQS